MKKLLTRFKVLWAMFWNSGSEKDCIFLAEKAGTIPFILPGKKRSLQDLARTFRGLGYKTKIY